MSLYLTPIFQKEAKEFIKKHHRHNYPPVGSIFQIAVAKDNKIVGVVVVGRPVARALQNGYTAEVTRLATDGTKNCCSKLYAAAWRAARSLGYKKLITYILDTEPGTSLRASGWKEIGKAGGGSWTCKSRPRIDKHSLQTKIRFEKEL
jgi:L-amino acid N-acyltransferase YncA